MLTEDEVDQIVARAETFENGGMVSMDQPPDWRRRDFIALADHAKKANRLRAGLERIRLQLCIEGYLQPDNRTPADATAARVAAELRALLEERKP